MTAGPHALNYLADWIAGFPLAGWKVAPPGYAALLVLAAIGGVMWTFRPVLDGILFAVGRTP